MGYGSGRQAAAWRRRQRGRACRCCWSWRVQPRATHLRGDDVLLGRNHRLHVLRLVVAGSDIGSGLNIRRGDHVGSSTAAALAEALQSASRQRGRRGQHQLCQHQHSGGLAERHCGVVGLPASSKQQCSAVQCRVQLVQPQRVTP